MGYTGPIISAVVAAVATGASIHQNEQARSDQRQARRGQEQAQGRAQASAQQAARREEDALRAENRKKPDISALLGDEGGRGLGDNLLTGSGGVDPSRLNLGRSTLLGG